jgi:hypothetical protein
MQARPNIFFHKYHDIMLTGKMITSALKYSNIGNTYSKPKKETTDQIKIISQKSSSVFTPSERDGLFWCFYVIKNGFAAYEYPQTTSFINEKNIKIQLIENLREKKQLLKTKKIKNIKEDVEDDLANQQKISVKTFIALCISENINVLFIHKRKYFEMICDENSRYHVIHKYDNPEKYCYEIDTSNEEIEKYKKDFFEMESFEKPLKAISNYKVIELLGFAKKLGLEEKHENIHKKNKKELYELLVLELS